MKLKLCTRFWNRTDGGSKPPPYNKKTPAIKAGDFLFCYLIYNVLPQLVAVDIVNVVHINTVI